MVAADAPDPAVASTKFARVLTAVGLAAVYLAAYHTAAMVAPPRPAVVPHAPRTLAGDHATKTDL